MVATLAWIEKEQPQLLQTADNTPFQFEAELLDSDTYDLELSIELTEPVLVLPARTVRASTSSTRPSRRSRRCSPGHGHVPPGLRQCRQARAVAHARIAGSMTGDDLAEIERLAGALLRTLSAGQRRKLLRKMARDLAASQRQRIAAQHQPDGSAFAPRKQKAQPVTGRGAACFLYPAGGSGPPRRVIMKSFTWGTGRSMTGFDIEAGGIRTFEFAKVVQWLPVPPEYRNRTSGRLRRREACAARPCSANSPAPATSRPRPTTRASGWASRARSPRSPASTRTACATNPPCAPGPSNTPPRTARHNPTDREHLLDLLYEQLAG
jgi:hypothetical protein